MKQVVKFIKPHSPYAVGDVAGLDKESAKIVLELGVAVPYQEGEEAGEVEEIETVSVDNPVEDKMVKSPKVKK